MTLRPVWVADPTLVWHVLTPADGPLRCRSGSGDTRCHRPAVAMLDRARTPRDRAWWAYCGDHLYGRRLVDGRIWQTIIVEDQEL